MTAAQIALTVALSVAGAAGLLFFCIFSNNALKITKYSVENAGVPQGGVRIVQLSDLHAKQFGKGNRRLIKKVAELSPDFIAITGDIVHLYRGRDIAVAQKLVADLGKIAPVCFVSGNHEMRSRRYRELKGILVAAGATVLDDEKLSVCGITLAGLNCASLKNSTAFTLADGKEGFTVLLAHEPQYISRYAAAGYDLVLCGHTHGGQWRVPFTDIGIYSPGQGLFPKYSAGMHICGGTTEIISRGLGNSECPLRLFNRPEIVFVELVPVRGEGRAQKK